MSAPDQDYVRWLVDRSMLGNAKLSARKYAGQSRLWQRPYAEPRPRAATALASVWFTTYPPSVVTAPGDSVLQTLGDPRLWDTLASLGVQAIHTGPTKTAAESPGETSRRASTATSIASAWTSTPSSARPRSTSP